MHFEAFEEFLRPLSIGKKKLEGSALESAYCVAHGKHQMGSYQEACDLFTHLILHNPFDSRFWRGLASSCQMRRSYEEALKAWAVFCAIENESAEGYFHAAECYLSIGAFEDAKRALLFAKKQLSGATHA